ncbi:hypothetical protein ONZ45_g2177 [Pleurotus djamor]|nr:hypothetical protein ONZ45_g2177 [Pleurotus djamor]
MWFARFIASFATFSELTNDERTRTFLALEIGGGHNELSEICNAITPVLKKIRQQAFYAEPRFHASFAWALLSTESKPGLDVDYGGKDQFPSIPKFPPELVRTLNDTFKERLASLTATTFRAEKIYVKIGRETAYMVIKLTSTLVD